MVASRTCEEIRIARFDTRSASTPPKGVASSIGMPKAMYTPPRAALLPASSLASQPRATTCACTATNEIVPAMNSSR